MNYYPKNTITCETSEPTLPDTHMHVSTARGVQLYKNNACTLLLRILSIVNSDWLLHAYSVRSVYEYSLI